MNILIFVTLKVDWSDEESMCDGAFEEDSSDEESSDDSIIQFIVPRKKTKKKPQWKCETYKH